MDGWRYVVTRASRPGNRIELSSISYAQAAGQFILVQMELTNRRDRTDYRSTRDFSLTDSAGDRISVAEYLGLRGWFLRTLGAETVDEPLPPRTTANVALLFDAPADARGLQLVIRAGSLLVSPSQITIDLAL
jgi:hypothetical protein